MYRRAVHRVRRLAHRLRHRRMRVNGADQLFDGDSSRSATAASATSSVARGPIMWTPSSSSYFFSATIFTKPSVSPAIFARPRTPNGNVPDAHVVAALDRLGFGQADAADLGIAVRARRHVIVVDRLHVAGRRCARRAAMPSADDRCASCGCAPVPIVITSPIAEMPGTFVRNSVVDLDVAAIERRGPLLARRGRRSPGRGRSPRAASRP